MPTSEPTAASRPSPTPVAAPASALENLSRGLRGRVAALGAVGAVMVVLPLVQVLRYQNAELQALLDQRARLDPMARSVQVQRGLMVHRDLAARVLRGQLALEPQRRQRRLEVDARLSDLAVAIAAGPWERAAVEFDDLHEDWTALAQRIEARSLAAEASDQSHRLLIEQVLQLMDLVADGGPQASGARDEADAALALVHELPRLAWQMARLEARPGDEADAPPQREAAVEAKLARLLGRIDAAQHGAAVTPLATATAAAGASAERYFEHLRAARQAAADPAAAPGGEGDAALQAQWQLYDRATDALRADLGRRDDAVAARRAALIAALTALAGLALVLARGLWRRAPLAPPPPAPQTQGAPAAETGRLMRRLRAGTAPATQDSGWGSRSVDHPPTLPPPRD
ncbi:MAG: hypothetical protein KGN16_25035 [Burkholderiales bacterium]|nr:hypothetical protein [Burkholderiales bacterium]